MTRKLFGTAQAILLSIFVLTPNAHAQPQILTVPTKFCTSNRPKLTAVERQVWKDLCLLFNDGDQADRNLQYLKENAEKLGMDLADYAKAYVSLYLVVTCDDGFRRACQLLEERRSKESQ